MCSSLSPQDVSTCAPFQSKKINKMYIYLNAFSQKNEHAKYWALSYCEQISCLPLTVISRLPSWTHLTHGHTGRTPDTAENKGWRQVTNKHTWIENNFLWRICHNYGHWFCLLQSALFHHIKYIETFICWANLLMGHSYHCSMDMMGGCHGLTH